VASMKVAVFCDLAPCTLGEVYCLHYHHPEHGRSKHLWNVDKFLPDYTSQHRRIQPSL
jgi:hypothetical protein